jgi:hypothetical protein
MVTPGSSITFPITRAITIGNMPNSPDVKVEVLWSDTDVISGAPTLLGYSTGRTITVTTTSTQGNAVIVLKIGSTTYWSWHIWVTDYPSKGATYTGTNNAVFMDRNLGATFVGRGSGAGTGLFYSYGNRTPNSYTGTSIVDAYNENKEKSVYDPCPEGWRVPSLTAFNTFTHATIVEAFMEGFTWDKYAVFPACGYRISDTIYEAGNIGAYLSTVNPRYWSGTIGYYFSPWQIRYGYVGSSMSIPGYGTTREWNLGLSVRCVRE